MSDKGPLQENKMADQISPGLLLRVKREQLEMTTDDVAKNIHLEKKIVEAIEADDYESLPAAIYVRGYLRSYAKIVGADAEHIIGLYNSDTPSVEPEILPEVKPPTQASSSDKPVKAFTYLISLGLVMLLLIWYQSNFVVDPNRTSKQKEMNADSTPAVINGVDTTYDVVVHPEGWQSPVYTDNEIPVYDESITVTDIKLDIQDVQTDDNSASIELVPTENLSTDQQVEIDTTGKASLVLKLSTDSWIEVYGADDERLFHDLGVAGQEYTIYGNAPLNILLGFSNGVEVVFNGKAFDQTPYSNNGIARFTLPVQ